MTTAHPPREEAENFGSPAVRLIPWSPSTKDAPPEAAISERLKYARSELSLSVEALARLTKRCDLAEAKGVSPSSLLRYENAESLPGARELRLLCEALEVPAQWLLMGQIQSGGISPAQQQLFASLAEVIREAVREVVKNNAAGEQVQKLRGALNRAAMLEMARKP